MAVWLPWLISDGMVLQRNAAVMLWGTADEPVTLSFLGREYRALPGRDGRWQVTLENLAPGGPYALSVNERTLHGVYVGDVWLCAGQSNMQLPMQRVRYSEPEAMQETEPRIRQFTVPQRHDYRQPLAELDSGSWQGYAPQTAADFSAVGYFFAKRLVKQYGVPVGLILTAIGGTPVHCWMSDDALSGFPALKANAEACTPEWETKTSAENERRTAAFYAAVNQSDPGLAEGWQNPNDDDKGWETCPLLTPWHGPGSIWLRRTVHIPPAAAGKPAVLFMGTVRDWDEAYLNGQRIGVTTYRYPPREYAIPALPSGKCVIALRVVSHAEGGFTPGKQYLLSTAAGAINFGGPWQRRTGGTGPAYLPETVIQNSPSGLYNGMIAPLTRYVVRGALWYQGESDAGMPDGYADRFRAMASAWRAAWGYDFPFLTVELAHWAEGEPGWSRLRAEQWRCLTLPGVTMAAADDLGEYNDLHPQTKRAVGERLARLAMRTVYGETMPPSPFEIIPLA